MTLGCTVTIDITANDKDRVGVDVVWNQDSIQLTILVIMLVSRTRLT